MKHLKLIAVTVGLILVVNATAGALSLPEGYFNMNIRNYDMGSMYDTQGNKIAGPTGGVAGEDGWGIFKVTTITNDQAQTIWADGWGGKELTGMFYGIVDTAVTCDLTNPLLPEWTIVGSNMHLDLWENPVGSLDLVGGVVQGSGGRMGTAGYNGITNAGGTNIITERSRLGGPGLGLPEYEAIVNAIGSGDFRTWMDITGGTQMLDFDTNMMLGGTDTYLSGDLQPNSDPTGNGNWQYLSSDPARGYAVPEPMTMTLLFLSVGGLAGYIRKRRQA